MVNEKMLMGRKVRIAWHYSKIELVEFIDREKKLSGHGEWFDYSEKASLEAWVCKMNKEHDGILYYLQLCDK
jgi:hypothetical protein